MFALLLRRRTWSSIGIGLLRGMDDVSERFCLSGIGFDTSNVSIQYRSRILQITGVSAGYLGLLVM